MEAQQVIDFPLPDEGMQQLALASPSQLSRQVDEHIKMGDTLPATKDVKPDNLFNSAQEYKKALQLSIAAPQRLSAYPDRSPRAVRRDHPVEPGFGTTAV